MNNTNPSGNAPNGHLAPLVCAFFLAIFSYQFNATMVAPALGNMSASLGISAAQASDTQTAFFTASALFSLFLPRLGDTIGRKRTAIGMLVCATAGSAMAAIAPNLPLLIIGRILQGATGPMISVCLIMLRDRVEDVRTYAKLTALVTCANGGIAGADALAGGWIAGHLGYRAVFWAIAVVGVAGIVMLAAFARDSKVERPTAMDWRGIAYLTCAVGILLMTVTTLRSGNAPIAPIAGALLLAVLLLAAFWKHEKKTPSPLVAPEFLIRRTTWSFLLTVFIAMTGIFAVMNGLAPAIAQDDTVGLGLSAGESTLATLVPYALVGMVTALIIGGVAARSGYLKVFRIGLAITAVATVLGAGAVLHLTPEALAGFSALFGLGYVGMVNVSINALGVELSLKNSPGTLPGLTAGTFNLASGISYLALYGVQGAATASHGATSGYACAMLAGAIITVCALGCSAIIGSKPRD